jgi:hypothetical protein
MTECLNLTIVRVTNSGREIKAKVLHKQLTGEGAPRTHQTLQDSSQSVRLSHSRVL